MPPPRRGVLRVFFFSSRRRHTRLQGDWSSDVCSSDLSAPARAGSTDRNLRTPPATPDPRPLGAPTMTTVDRGLDAPSAIEGERLMAPQPKPAGRPRRRTGGFTPYALLTPALIVLAL